MSPHRTSAPLAASLRLALHSLASRRGRTALLAGAVALAAALIVAVSCGVRSGQASFDDLISKFIGAADARIIHPASERFDAGTLETVRSWPGVEAATARLYDTLTLVHADHRLDPETGLVLHVSPIVGGVDFASEPQFREIELVEGRMPARADEILIGSITAERLGAGADDRLVVRRFGPPLEVTVAGVYHRQQLGTLQRPRARADLGFLAEVREQPGRVSSIVIMLDDEVDVATFCAAHGPSLPAPLVLEAADMVRTGFDQRIRASRLALLVLSVLTFLVAGFIIVIGLTTGMTERQREMAILRCVGAARGQLLVSQLLVGLGYGLFGAIAGAPLGLAFSGLLVWVFDEYVPGGLVIDARGLTLAVIGSVGAGLLGAVLPAFLASRVAPLTAMARTARPPRARVLVACGLAGLACVAAQLALYAVTDIDLRIRLYAFAGLPLVCLGAFLIAVPTLALVTIVIGPMLARLVGLPPDTLRAAIMTTPLRHGLTAGGLMVGLAILVASWANTRSIMGDWIDRVRFADGFAQRITGLTKAEQAAIADLPFVESTCAIGYFSIQLDRRVFGLEDVSPRAVNCISFDAAQFFGMNDVEWLEGDPAQAIPMLEAGTGVVVAEQFLTARDLGVGDRIGLGVGELWQEFEIAGVVSSAGLDLITQLFGIRSRYLEYAVSCVFMDAAVVKRLYDTDTVVMMQVNLSEAITDDEATAAVLEAAPGVLFRSGRWIRTTIEEIVDGLLIVQVTVAFVALVLAAVAVGNVLAAAINGRRFEYGVLRAVGATPGMLVRLVLAESLLMAVAASITGAAFGVYLSWIDILNLRALIGLPLHPNVPVGPILLGSLVLIILTLLAALPSVVRLARKPPAMLVAVGRNE